MESFTNRDFEASTIKLNVGKKTGLDLIIAEVVKTAMKETSGVLFKMLNKRFKNRRFPDSSKEASMVLIEKMKNSGQPRCIQAYLRIIKPRKSV